MVLGQPRAVSTFPRHPASNIFPAQLPSSFSLASPQTSQVQVKLSREHRYTCTHPKKKSAPMHGSDRKAGLPARLLLRAGTQSVQVDSFELQKDLWSLN